MLLLVLVVGYLSTAVAEAEEDSPVYHLTVENEAGDSMYMVCTPMPVPGPMKEGVRYR